MERPRRVGQNAACRFETVTMTDLSADSAARTPQSLDDVAEAKLAALERRRLRRRLTTTERTSAQRHHAKRPRARVVLVQRLSRAVAAPRRDRGESRGDAPLRRRRGFLAARERQPPALRRARAQARRAQGDRRCGRVRQRLPHERRHDPGARRQRGPDTDRRAQSQLPARGRASSAARASSNFATTTSRMRTRCLPSSARATGIASS